MKKERMLFKNYMKKEYGIEVEIDESGWEGVTLYHEEIDTDLIPKEKLKSLPDPLLVLTTSYEDSEGQEWIFCLLTKEHDAGDWLHALCLKNEEIFATIPVED